MDAETAVIASVCLATYGAVVCAVRALVSAGAEYDENEEGVSRTKEKEEAD